MPNFACARSRRRRRPRTPARDREAPARRTARATRAAASRARAGGTRTAPGRSRRLAGRERDVLLERDTRGSARERPRDRSGAGVGREHLHNQLGPIVGGSERRHDLRVTQRNRTAAGERDRTVEAHHLVGRHRVPVDEGDGEVVRRRGGHQNGKGVRTGLCRGGDVDLVDAVGACGLRGVGDLPAVEPGVEAEVDAVHPQPQRAALRLRRERELGAVPPGHGKGAVRGHRLVREVRADLVGHSRERAQVHPVIGIGVAAVGDERRDDCRRHRRSVPARVAKPGRDTASPPAVTFAEDWIAQPSRSSSRRSAAEAALATSAVSDTVRTGRTRAGCMKTSLRSVEATPARRLSSSPDPAAWQRRSAFDTRKALLQAKGPRPLRSSERAEPARDGSNPPRARALQ